MTETLEARLGHTFTDPELLRRALTHRSHHFENRLKSVGHFERLEFLGDAVLDLVLSELLMSRFDEADEGVLSKWRASLVNERSLGEVARELGLAEHLYLGRSEEPRRKDMRARLLGSALEALLGAIYLDAGLETVKATVARLFESRLAELKVERGYHADFKTRLQEWAQRAHKTTPKYRLVEAVGPEHEKTFSYEVLVDAKVLAVGAGASRKGAEQNAAHHALARLEGVQK